MTTESHRQDLLNRDEMNSIKGLLIILIALGHNTIATNAIPGLLRFLYSFHVFAFLLIPFCRSGTKTDSFKPSTVLIRYMVPYIVFFTVYSLLYLVMTDHASIASCARWARNFALGMAIGSKELVDEASGFQLFWFLPALVSCLFLRHYFNSSSRMVKCMFLICMLGIHPIIGNLPSLAKSFVPWGIHIAAYVFPLGILVALVTNRISRQNLQKIGFFGALLFALLQYASFQKGSIVNLGAAYLYGFNNLRLMFLHDAIAVTGFLAVFGCAPWLSRVPGMSYIGQRSIQVYLLHSMVFQFILRVLPFGVITEAAGAGCTLLATFALTLFLSLFTANLFLQKTLRDTFFPKDLGGWIPMRAFRTGSIRS